MMVYRIGGRRRLIREFELAGEREGGGGGEGG